MVFFVGCLEILVVRALYVLLFFTLFGVLLYFFFFFSSRRRHTRCLSDWSSDVCSSDLMRRASLCRLADRPPAEPRTTTGDPRHSGWPPPGSRTCHRDDAASAPPPGPRSEERRVGKECRARWSPEHQREQRKCSERRKGM